MDLELFFSVKVFALAMKMYTNSSMTELLYYRKQLIQLIDTQSDECTKINCERKNLNDAHLR